ncbi:lysozyme C-1-like [Erythrolamprus reginae]|uniref:lysozyme C-1-like n=1 Tax=Erythrolamprus reginae TaxID=121349 RepID=UPI00396C92A9
MKALVLTLLFLLIAANEAKKISCCDLASLLKQNDIDGYKKTSLEDWVCMAYHESKYNSQVVGPPNTDRDYGIFQINSGYWCNNNQGPTANKCNKLCSDFTNDDITDDIACAKRIVRDHKGMNAWRG